MNSFKLHYKHNKVVCKVLNFWKLWAFWNATSDIELRLLLKYLLQCQRFINPDQLVNMCLMWSTTDISTTGLLSFAALVLLMLKILNLRNEWHSSYHKRKFQEMLQETTYKKLIICCSIDSSNHYTSRCW